MMQIVLDLRATTDDSELDADAVRVVVNNRLIEQLTNAVNLVANHGLSEARFYSDGRTACPFAKDSWRAYQNFKKKAAPARTVTGFQVLPETLKFPAKLKQDLSQYIIETVILNADIFWSFTHRREADVLETGMFRLAPLVQAYEDYLRGH